MADDNFYPAKSSSVMSMTMSSDNVAVGLTAGGDGDDDSTMIATDLGWRRRRRVAADDVRAEVVGLSSLVVG